MSVLRLSHILAGATTGLLLASVPTAAAAQGCTAHSCSAVNRVQVTVPAWLGLSAGGPAATVRANTAWRLQVSAGQPAASSMVTGKGDWSKVTQVRDIPAASTAAVRYTLVGS